MIVNQSELTRLAQCAGESLSQHNLLLTLAESCTGGGIAQSITDIAGSSAWFERGFVTYSNASKQELLDVNPQTLAQFGAVSLQTALEMAQGALRNSHADLAYAVTGIAGPSGGSPDKPVGCIYMAWQFKQDQAMGQHLQFAGNRSEIRHQVITHVLMHIVALLSQRLD